MPLQRFNEYGEKGDEAFGADAVGGIPGQEERVLDVRSIPAKMCVPMRLLHLRGIVEEPPGVFRHITGGSDKSLQ